MALHKTQTLDDIHALTARGYADITARDADIDFQVAGNINKMVRIDSPVSYFILVSVGPPVWSEASSTGLEKFTELTDTPADYTGQALKLTRVNAGETGIEFTDTPTLSSLTLTDDLIVQGVAGIGTATPDASAVLDMASITQGVLPPRMTTAQRDAIPSPASGLTIYNTSTDIIEFFNSVSWVAGMGGGDVNGPASSVDNAISRFNGVGGKNIQNSLVIIDDAGAMIGLTSLDVDNLRLDGNTISTVNTDGDLIVIPNGSGDVLIGSGSTIVDINGQQVMPANTVVIAEASDMPTTLVTGKHYLIVAPITITAGNEITIPDAASITISSTDRLNNTLTYSGTTGTLFTSAAQTGAIRFRGVNLIGGGSTSRLFSLTGSGLPSISLNECDIKNWGTVSTITGFDGGITVGTCGGSNNTGGVFNIVNSIFFEVENSFFENSSDTSSNFFTIDALTSRVVMVLVGVLAQPNENVFLIDSSFTGGVIISTQFGTPAGQLFDAAGLDGTSIHVDVLNASNQPDSTTSAELFLAANTATTSIPAAGAMVELNVDVNWTDDAEQMTISTDGVVTLDTLNPVNISFSGNINMEPATASKSLSVRTVLIQPAEIVVTFTNATNLINETATALVDGDTVSFRDTAGTLPAEIRADVVYFVVSKLTNSFQISYTFGGSAIAFTDDGTPTNSYKFATLEGATPTNTITANAPRDLIPQAGILMVTDSKVFLVVTNNDDSVDIDVISGYQRYNS